MTIALRRYQKGIEQARSIARDINYSNRFRCCKRVTRSMPLHKTTVTHSGYAGEFQAFDTQVPVHQTEHGLPRQELQAYKNLT